MKMIDIIKNFIHKAKQEAAKEYNVEAVSKQSPSQSSDEKKFYKRTAWIGVDLDGTLARSDTLWDVSKIGDPIPKMVELVLRLTGEGNRVKIFTARASDAKQVEMIHKWLKANGLPELEVTNVKDYEMIRFYDDRAVQVVTNTGELVEPE